MAALNHVRLVDHHVVAQIVKTELIVGTVGDVGLVGLLALGGGHIVDHQADGQAQEAVDLAHPFAVALGQVVVDGDHVDALAGQGVEVDGHGGHQGLAFTGLHLGDAGAMQHDAADDLYRVGFQAQHTPVGLAADGKGLGQQIVQGLALFQTVAEFIGLGTQLLVGELLHLGVQVLHLLGNGTDAFEFLVREIPEQLFNKGHKHTPVLSDLDSISAQQRQKSALQNAGNRR